MTTGIIATSGRAHAFVATFDVGGVFEKVIQWLQDNLDPVFGAATVVIDAVLESIEAALLLPPWGSSRSS